MVVTKWKPYWVASQLINRHKLNPDRFKMVETYADSIEDVAVRNKILNLLQKEQAHA